MEGYRLQAQHPHLFVKPCVDHVQSRGKIKWPSDCCNEDGQGPALKQCHHAFSLLVERSTEFFLCLVHSGM